MSGGKIGDKESEEEWENRCYVDVEIGVEQRNVRREVVRWQIGDLYTIILYLVCLAYESLGWSRCTLCEQSFARINQLIIVLRGCSGCDLSLGIKIDP